MLPVAQTAEAFVAQVREAHAYPEIRIVDEVMDQAILGALPAERERRRKRHVSDAQLSSRYAGEEPWAGGSDKLWTSYNNVKSMAHALQIGAEDVVYDLGSGYGRVPLYLGMVTAAQCKGIEMVDYRVEAAAAATKRFNLPNVDMLHGKVQDHDISDGTIFYLYSPFSPRTFRIVIEQIRTVAKQHEVKIAVCLAKDMFTDSRDPWVAGWRYASSRFCSSTISAGTTVIHNP